MNKKLVFISIFIVIIIALLTSGFIYGPSTKIPVVDYPQLTHNIHENTNQSTDYIIEEKTQITAKQTQDTSIFSMDSFRETTLSQKSTIQTDNTNKTMLINGTRTFNIGTRQNFTEYYNKSTKTLLQAQPTKVGYTTHQTEQTTKQPISQQIQPNIGTSNKRDAYYDTQKDQYVVELYYNSPSEIDIPIQTYEYILRGPPRAEGDFTGQIPKSALNYTNMNVTYTVDPQTYQIQTIQMDLNISTNLLVDDLLLNQIKQIHIQTKLDISHRQQNTINQQDIDDDIKLAQNTKLQMKPKNVTETPDKIRIQITERDPITERIHIKTRQINKTYTATDNKTIILQKTQSYNDTVDILHIGLESTNGNIQLYQSAIIGNATATTQEQLTNEYAKPMHWEREYGIKQIQDILGYKSD